LPFRASAICAGILALFDVLADQPVEVLQRRRRKAEARGVG
jgi:hypothetical protein